MQSSTQTSPEQGQRSVRRLLSGQLEERHLELSSLSALVKSITPLELRQLLLQQPVANSGHGAQGEAFSVLREILLFSERQWRLLEKSPGAAKESGNMLSFARQFCAPGAEVTVYSELDRLGVRHVQGLGVLFTQEAHFPDYMPTSELRQKLGIAPEVTLMFAGHVQISQRAAALAPDGDLGQRLVGQWRERYPQALLLGLVAEENLNSQQSSLAVGFRDTGVKLQIGTACYRYFVLGAEASESKAQGEREQKQRTRQLRSQELLAPFAADLDQSAAGILVIGATSDLKRYCAALSEQYPQRSLAALSLDTQPLSARRAGRSAAVDLPMWYAIQLREDTLPNFLKKKLPGPEVSGFGNRLTEDAFTTVIFIEPQKISAASFNYLRGNILLHLAPGGTYVEVRPSQSPHLLQDPARLSFADRLQHFALHGARTVAVHRDHRTSPGRRQPYSHPNHLEQISQRRLPAGSADTILHENFRALLPFESSPTGKLQLGLQRDVLLTLPDLRPAPQHLPVSTELPALDTRSEQSDEPYKQLTCALQSRHLQAASGSVPQGSWELLGRYTVFPQWSPQQVELCAAPGSSLSAEDPTIARALSEQPLKQHGALEYLDAAHVILAAAAGVFHDPLAELAAFRLLEKCAKPLPGFVASPIVLTNAADPASFAADQMSFAPASQRPATETAMHELQLMEHYAPAEHSLVSTLRHRTALRVLHAASAEPQITSTRFLAVVALCRIEGEVMLGLEPHSGRVALVPMPAGLALASAKDTAMLDFCQRHGLESTQHSALGAKVYPPAHGFLFAAVVHPVWLEVKQPQPTLHWRPLSAYIASGVNAERSSEHCTDLCSQLFARRAQRAIG